MFPSADAEAHLKRLAIRHGIEIHYIKAWKESEAHPGVNQVYIPTPTSGFRYLCGLHEIGHLVDKVAARVVCDHYAASEAAAWDWAVKHADANLLTWMTPRQWTNIALAWLTGVTDLSPDVR